MDLTDLHIHLLCGVDDGAKTEADMYAMLDAACKDGTRVLCATPHFHPGFWGDNVAAAGEAFAKLTTYAKEKYPDLRLCRGNELRYSRDCVNWLDDGRCRTLNGTQFVLVDFSQDEDRREIVRGLESLLNAGYSPVLAHTERYRHLGPSLGTVAELRENGVLIQVDSQSVTGGFGHGAKYRARKLLAGRLVDLVASDAHDRGRRPPGLSACYDAVTRQCGASYAQILCAGNPKRILSGMLPERNY